MLEYEIYVDHGETPNKCTILPLAYRTNFSIIRGKTPDVLRSDILLHPEGDPIPSLNLNLLHIQRIAAIDCIWRRLDPILDSIQKPLPVFASIPNDFVTAYPRVSKKDFDPDGGLATIEAIFVAAALVGTWDQSLLREYFFAEKFLYLNDAAFRRYGITPEFQTPVFDPRNPRNSRTRRIGRGRVPKS